MNRFSMRPFLTAILAGCLLTVFSTGAQSPPSRPEPGFFAVITADLDTASQWYSCTFGLAEDSRTELAARGIRQANLSARNFRIELIQLEGSADAEELLSGREGISRIEGFFKVGFTVKRFDRWLERLQYCGTDLRGDVVNDPVTGKRMVIALDPDGNRLQFFER